MFHFIAWLIFASMILVSVCQVFLLWSRLHLQRTLGRASVALHDVAAAVGTVVLTAAAVPLHFTLLTGAYYVVGMSLMIAGFIGHFREAKNGDWRRALLRLLRPRRVNQD